MREKKIYRVPSTNMELFKTFMEENDFDFDMPTMVGDGIVVTMGRDSIAVEINKDKLEEELKTLKRNFIDNYYKNDNINTQVDLGDNLSLSLKDEYYSYFDKIMYELSSTDYICSIMHKIGYDYSFFKNYIVERFDVVDFAETVADVKFDENQTNIVDKGKLVIADEEYIDRYIGTSTMAYALDVLDDVATITDDKNAALKNDVHNEMANALALAAVENEYYYAADCYSKEAYSRISNLGNVNKIYITDVFDYLPTTVKEKLDEEKDYMNGCKETEKFYRFCCKYCVNENNFKSDITAFYRILDMQLFTYRMFDKKTLKLN